MKRPRNKIALAIMLLLVLCLGSFVFVSVVTCLLAFVFGFHVTLRLCLGIWLLVSVFWFIARLVIRK